MATIYRIRKRFSAFRRAPDGSAFEKCEGCGRSVAIALADMHECEPKKGIKRFRGVNVNQLTNKCSDVMNQHVTIISSEDGNQHVTITSSEDVKQPVTILSSEDVNQHVTITSSEDVNQRMTIISSQDGNRHVTNKSFEDQPRSPFRLFMEVFVKINNGGTMIEIDRKGFETWKNMSKEERQPFVLHAQKLESAYQKALDKEVNDMIQVDDEADSAMVGKIDKSYQFCCEEASDYSECFSEYSDGWFSLEE